ncbi:MAG: FKBP-type peptidyl-prolyl cis-trans isomerase [Candidatus Dormibacteria bacterium]
MISLRVGRVRRGVAAASLLAALSGCGSDALPSGAATSNPVQTPAAATPTSCADAASSVDKLAQTVPLTKTGDGLEYGDITVGTGAMPRSGEKLTVQYTGWLSNGCVFDSSRKPGGSPFSFVIGANPPNVIAGWEEGLLTMRVGGRRRLVIPPVLAYGPAGQGAIPPNATLTFDVELLSTG